MLYLSETYEMYFLMYGVPIHMMLIQNNMILPVAASFNDSCVLTADLFFLVQNGAVTQKDTLNDDEFEPYLSTQARQVRVFNPANLSGPLKCVCVCVCNSKFIEIYLIT